MKISLFAAALVTVLSVVDAAQHPKIKLSKNSKKVADSYIIELETSYTGTHASFLKSIASKFENADITMRQTYDSPLFKGMSVKIGSTASVDGVGKRSLHHTGSSGVLAAFAESPEVRTIYPNTITERPKVTVVSKSHSNSPELMFAHNLTQVTTAHNYGYYGKGLTVGILDTGVDYTHPALGGCFGKGCKVALGYDLVGDAYDADKNPHPVPDNDPLDACGANSGAEGHGTHVSGIVAADDHKYNFTGVAPQAKLGMWRIFGCTGTVSDDIIIQAMLMAYEAKVDIISLSLGGSSNWEEEVGSVVADRIVGKGVPVVIAAGNAGADGYGQIGSPGTGKRVTTVASFDNSHFLAAYFVIAGHEDTKYPYVLSSHASPSMPNGPIVPSASTDTVTNDACNGSPVSSQVSGKIALVRRGGCTFDEKAASVEAAGAIGMLVYDQSGGGAFSPGSTTNTIPVAGISTDAGEAIFAATHGQRPVSVEFFTDYTAVAIASADTVSSFSSIGPLNENQFKPNIAGIGGQVFSTLPLYLGGYGTYSGTSMATPYISGSIALFLEATGKHQDPTYILEKFQNFAHLAPVTNGMEGLDNPIRQGAGLVQIVDTIKDAGHVSPAQISFNDTAHLVTSVTLKISNKGKTAITYTISNNQSMAVSPFDVANSGYTPLPAIAYTTDAATLRFSTRRITVKPGKTVTVKVSVVPPKTNPKDHIHYGGFVQFKASGNAKTIHVPYFGVVGNNKDLPIFDTTLLGLYSNDLSTEYTSNQTYVLDRSNLATTTPYIVYRLLSGTAYIEAQLLDSNKQFIGYTETDLAYIPRNTLESGAQYYQTTWQGSYVPKGFKQTSSSVAAPDGYYWIKFRALKQFGNPAKNSDFETWLSPRIQLKN
ncbi:hypothetical protein INT44_008438 [Umbelopsis vinacea]|uniref:Uncharacterized protein n=1 Tax=Umbelopsis vinacea TaxID=44442 RepID=A0A8H7PWN4_9FUNG|nr:hypothetical protein INT44_008438 [Umbelopsis vinacea]